MTIPPLLILLAAIAVLIFLIIKACTRRTALWIVLASIASLFFFGAIGIGSIRLMGRMVSAVKESDQLKQVLHSPDKRFSLTVPRSWKSMPDINDDACIAAGNTLGTQFVIVIAEEPENDETDLAEFAAGATEQLADSLANANLGDLGSISVSGLPAVRRVVSGKSDGINVVFQHTSLIAGDHFVQIMGWTEAGRQKSAFARFSDIAATFKTTSVAQTAKSGPEAQVHDLIADLLGAKQSKLVHTAKIQEDLGADELDLVELVMAVEDHFDLSVSDEEASKWKTVGDVVSYVEKHAKPATAKPRR